MTAEANMPVLYLEAHKDSISYFECKGDSITMKMRDQLFELPQDVLVVLGKYQCGKSMLVGKNWKKENDRITFDIYDPKEENVSGHYKIDVNQRKQKTVGCISIVTIFRKNITWNLLLNQDKILISIFHFLLDLISIGDFPCFKMGYILTAIPAACMEASTWILLFMDHFLCRILLD